MNLSHFSAAGGQRPPDPVRVNRSHVSGGGPVRPALAGRQPAGGHHGRRAQHPAPISGRLHADLWRGRAADAADWPSRADAEERRAAARGVLCGHAGHVIDRW